MKTIYGYISDYIRSLDPATIYDKLPVHRKLLFKIQGIVTVEKAYVKTPDGVEGESRIYLVRCPKCKAVFVDYEHGFNGYVECPRCGERI